MDVSALEAKKKAYQEILDLYLQSGRVDDDNVAAVEEALSVLDQEIERRS